MRVGVGGFRTDGGMQLVANLTRVETERLMERALLRRLSVVEVARAALEVVCGPRWVYDVEAEDGGAAVEPVVVDRVRVG